MTLPIIIVVCHAIKISHFLNLCLVDCEWGTYSPWTGCTETCGSGKQYRFRVIEKYESNGGASCDADQNVDEQDCNTESCPTLGKFYFRYYHHFQSDP